MWMFCVNNIYWKWKKLKKKKKINKAICKTISRHLNRNSFPLFFASCACHIFWFIFVQFVDFFVFTFNQLIQLSLKTLFENGGKKKYFQFVSNGKNFIWLWIITKLTSKPTPLAKVKMPSSQSPIQATSRVLFFLSNFNESESLNHAKGPWLCPTFSRLISNRTHCLFARPTSDANGCTSNDVPIIINKSHSAKSFDGKL